MSEKKRIPTYVEIFEKEISDLRTDVNRLTESVQKMLEYESAVGNRVGKLIERLQYLVRLLEVHKDNEATIMALQAMSASLDMDKGFKEVREYARSRGKSVREAFVEMETKGTLPENLRNFAQTRKLIRELL